MTTTIKIPTSTYAALDGFVEAFSDDMLALHLGQLMTCIEVEALADLLRAQGEDTAAATWLECHSEGDECDDQHCKCDDCKEA